MLSPCPEGEGSEPYIATPTCTYKGYKYYDGISWLQVQAGHQTC